MKPTINCITLPVDDLQKSFAFYRDGLGMPAEGMAGEQDHVAFELPGDLYLVLISRSEFAGFAGFVDQSTAQPGISECILSYFASSREEVDSVLESARSAGASPTTPKDNPWGYSGYFTDPDGHMWEVTWIPDPVEVPVE
ncbi:MAG: VOC family protein [Dehalococcoidia bacterium]